EGRSPSPRVRRTRPGAWGPPPRLGQLGVAAALGATLGAALSPVAGLALGTGVPLGAVLAPGEPLGEFGVGHVFSRFVRPPHCCQNWLTRFGSQLSIMSTR